jgi:hypothetical protein
MLCNLLIRTTPFLLLVLNSEVLLWYYPVICPSKTTEHLSQNYWCPGRDSSRKPSEYNSEAILPEPTFLVSGWVIRSIVWGVRGLRHLLAMSSDIFNFCYVFLSRKIVSSSEHLLLRAGDNVYSARFSVKNKLYSLVISLMTVLEFLCETVQSIFAWNFSSLGGLYMTLGHVNKRQPTDISCLPVIR